MNRIEFGLPTLAAIREAATTELKTCIELIMIALMRTCYPEERPEATYMLDVVAIYPDHAVVKKDARYWSYPYTIDDSNNVSVGAATEVLQEFEAVTLREADGAGITADGETPLSYEICLVKAGQSHNKNYYSDAVLREAAQDFENVRVFVKSDAEHLDDRHNQNKDLTALVGHVEGVRFVEGAAPDTGKLVGVLRLLESAHPIPEKIHETWRKGVANKLFGFSIDAHALVRRVRRGAEVVREALRFAKVNSLDLVIEPSAGGEIIRVLEAVISNAHSHNEDNTMTLTERMVEAVKRHRGGTLPDGFNTEDEAALLEAYNATLQPAQSQTQPANDPGAPDDTLRLVEARSEARETIRDAALPDKAKDRLLAQLRDGALTPERVTEAVNAERDYLASVAPGAQIEGLGDPRIEPGESRGEKVGKMLDDLFDPDKRDVISIKECYIDFTGDKRVTGRLKDCDMSRLREARGERLTEAVEAGDWANALGDSLHRRLLMLYNEGSIYDLPLDLVDEVPAVDFRDRTAVTLGGYGDLSTVAESGAYSALTSPGDEAQTYAVSKKGGTETITLETIKNDDVGAVMRMPMELANAAKRTLSKSIYAHLSGNPAIADKKKLFHADHKNLNTAALSATSLKAVRLKQRKQPRLGTGERIGIPPMHLWIPDDLEATAYDLFQRTTNNDPNFVNSLRMTIHTVWSFTDVNDWFTTVDKRDMPLIELAYLDDQREPEIFVQDMQTVGSMFTNDRITYKIRHIYGSSVADYRGFQGSLVA